MRDLALIGMFMTAAVLPGCNDKGGDTEGASESSTGTTGTTEPGSTTGSAGEGSSTTGEPTTGEPGSTGEGSSGSTGTTIDEDCAFLIGKTFVSKQQFPCGPPMDPNDPGELCPDTVSFEVETFDYMSGDYGVGGDYVCEAGEIVGISDFEMFTGEIDASTGLLVWETLEFLPE